jgi:hypothetical protein
MRKLFAACLLATLAVIAAGPAYAQTVSANLDFIGTGNASFTTASNWVEVSIGEYPPDPNWQTLGQNRVPGDRDTARIRNGANVTLNSNLPYVLHMWVGGPGVQDPNWNGDPNVYPFTYLPMPTSTLNIATGATLIIDPNQAEDTGKGGNCSIGSFYNGTVNMTGGSFAPCWFRLGEGMGSTGILNLSGGTMDVRYRMNVGRMGGKTGSDGSGITQWGSGYGEINQSGDSVVKSSRVSAGQIIEELWLGTVTSVTTSYFDPNGNQVVASWGGKGVYNMSGGVACQGKLRIGKYQYWSNPFNPTDPNGSWLPCEGVLNITGGSMHVDTIECGSNGGKGSIYVGTGGTLKTRDYCFIGGTSTGDANNWRERADMRVGVGAEVYLGIDTTGGALIIPDGVYAKLLKMDVSSAGNALIKTGGDASLGSKNTLDMNSIGGFRPKQGDAFTIIQVLGSGQAGYGNFATFTSNIANGLDPNWNDPNTTAPRAFTGDWTAEDYIVTFRGFTGGDATQDGNVSLGDIGIVAGNWNKNSQTWAQGDFTGDGVVGLGDIGILAGNWGWTRPGGAPVPEPGTMALLALGGVALIRRRR